MEKCVYCGKEHEDSFIMAKAHTREFEVCDIACKECMEMYLKKDKKYKTWMYLMVFIGGIGFLVSALLGKGQFGMLGAYLGQILGGAAFLFFPYPIMSMETFYSVSMKKVTWISRIIGLVLMIWGIILLAFM